MKVLITGGAGFIASHIVDRLIDEGQQVVIIDNMSTGKEYNLNPNAKFYKMDICDPAIELIFKEEKPDYVNHHAAQMSVIKSIQNPQFDINVNILGSYNIMQLSYKYGIKKIIYISSGGTVYGEPMYLPVDEDHINYPLSPYGIDKLAVEKYLYMYGAVYGLNYTILRYANVYGPRQDPYGEAGVIAIFTQNIMDGIQPTIFGDGTDTRDYVYIDDVVDANMLALNLGGMSVYNISANRETSVNEIFTLVSNELNYNDVAVHKGKRPGEIQHICLDNHKVYTDLGWEPNITIEEGIKKTVQDYKREAIN